MSDRRIKFTWPPKLCLLLGIAAAVFGRFALELFVGYYDWSYDHREIALVLARKEIVGQIWFTTALGLLTTAVLTLAALFGLVLRHKFTLGFFRKACLFSNAAVLMYGVVVLRATGIVMSDNLSVDGDKPDPYAIFMWRWELLWPALLVSLAMAYLYILAWRRVAIRQWVGGDETEPAMGDLFLENLRTHGRDPRFRKSMWTSMNLHLFVVFVLPLLLTMFGCVTPYRVPKGSGSPETEGKKAAKKVIIKKVVKKPKKRRILVSPTSTISFNFPDLDYSKVAQEVEMESRDTYKTDVNRVFVDGSLAGEGTTGGRGTGKKGIGTGKRKMGKGGGDEGGWPDGMENSLVRFIRMKYDGSGWDDGMDAVTRADMNFLDYFRKLTEFKTATRSESHSMTLLSKYPKGYAPPFVYMTGDGSIHVSDREVRAMREYLMGGGMLFADCGSPGWHGAFQSFITRVLPGESLLRISDDDVLFRLPFAFPNGAPPIWHHGGRHALGVKYKGRWAVFYHPGDLNDAWKSNKGGLTPKMAQDALDMGVNIIYYSFSNYLELTRKYRR